MPTDAEPVHRVVSSATFSVIALGVSALAALRLDSLGPRLGTYLQPLSSFAHSDYAWLWRLSVGAGAAGVLLLALALQGQDGSRLLRALLATAGAGLAAAGSFTADLWFPWERRPTPGGAAHALGVLMVVIAFTVATSRGMGSLRRGRYRMVHRVTEMAYLATLVSALAYVAATAAMGRPPLLFGLWERLLLGSALAWCVLLAMAEPTRSPNQALASRA